MSQDKPNKENENIDNVKTTEETVDHSHKDDSEIKEGKLKKYIGSKRGKTILSMLFVAIIGIGAGFYVGTDVGRNLPATHKSYTKSQVLASVGDVKITGSDFSKEWSHTFTTKG